jgi:hypothetical protein
MDELRGYKHLNEFKEDTKTHKKMINEIRNTTQDEKEEFN